MFHNLNTPCFHACMQENYIFDPAVITFGSIALGTVNTSFYRREGASNINGNLIVDLLLQEVHTCDVINITVHVI